MTTQVESPATAARGTLRHRRSVEKLSAAELARLRAAFSETMELKDENGYWYFAGWHGEPFAWCKHNSPIFLPWHRAYLYYLELALQAKAPGVTLPWWDWTAAGGLPQAYTEDVPGEANPLKGEVVKVYGSFQPQQPPPREPGSAAELRPPAVPPLPYKSQWDHAMTATSFTEFQTRIEDIHGWVHVWVGGIMGVKKWAAYDPIFFAHHAMVDRTWRLWQHKNPGAIPQQDLLDIPLKPNGMTVRQTLDVHQLGYEYAGTASHVQGNA